MKNPHIYIPGEYSCENCDFELGVPEEKRAFNKVGTIIDGNHQCPKCQTTLIHTSWMARASKLNQKVRWFERYNTDQIQDRCENAYVEVSRWDAALQALAEVAPDHPLLKGAHPNYGVWTMMQKRLEELEGKS